MQMPYGNGKIEVYKPVFNAVVPSRQVIKPSVWESPCCFQSVWRKCTVPLCGIATGLKPLAMTDERKV